MLFIDLHAHLDHCYFKDDLDEAIKRAEKEGVKIILANGINPETNRKVLEFAKKYKNVKAALGIYPIEALQKEMDSGEYPGDDNKFDLDKEIEFIKKNKDNILALGEIGLDYKMSDDREQQINVFKKLLMLAEDIDKPVIIHSRKAEEDVVKILEKIKHKKIILHCFSGKKKLMQRAVANGWYFTIPTNVTRSHQFQELVKMLPLSQMFCETDSPYLSPFPGRRNEPAFVVESYKKIAELKEMELQEVANIIYNNWQKVFE